MCIRDSLTLVFSFVLDHHDKKSSYIIKINDNNLLKDVLCIVFYSFLSNDTLFSNVKKSFIKNGLRL